MADPISAVGASNGSATLRFTQPAGDSSAVTGELSLSDAARSALKSISNMHASFDSATAAVENQPKTIGPALEAARSTAEHPADAVADVAKVVSAQIESSIQVQEQLAKFVMVSSVSSSFGRNLNMFLRGQ